jgi:hypothetical protein
MRFLPDYGLFNQRPRRTQKIPEKDHFCRVEDDCLFLRRILWVLRHVALHQQAYACGLCEGRARVHACRPYTGRVYLYDFVKIK